MPTDRTDTLLGELKTELDANAALTGDVVVESQVILSNATFEDNLSASLEADGTVVAIYIPSFTNDLPNVSGPAPEIRILAEVWFNPVHTNATRDTITEEMEKVASCLHHFVPASLSRALVVTQGSPRIDDGFIVYPVLIQQTIVYDET